MKTKIKKLCATIVTVILSIICAGCGDLSALKTKYIAELDAYYQEIEAMHLEYTTALIENEIRTGQNKIQQLTTTSEILMEVQHTKQRVQEYMPSKEDLAKIKEELGMQNSTFLAYMGKTSKGGYHIIVLDFISTMGVDYCPNIGGYIFRMHSRRIEIAKSVDDFDELKSAFYTNKLIDEEEIAEIYERYTVVYNYTPNIFAPGFSLNK